MLDQDQEKQECVCYAVEEFGLAKDAVNLEVMRTGIQPTEAPLDSRLFLKGAVLYRGQPVFRCT